MDNSIFTKDIASLLLCVSSRLERLADKNLFEPIGLSAISFKILAITAHYHQVQPSDLVKFLGTSKSNITQRLKLLEKYQLIRRHVASGSQDGRLVFFSLTELGLQKITEVRHKIKLKKFQVESLFSPDETKNFINLLEKLNNHLNSYEKLI